MAIKDRKIYGLVNFRGLDKENKPLKVSPFRAVDGENFIIDSETLKTRPAFKYKKTPFKDDDHTIIDYYQYGELFVYVVETGFVIVFNNKILTNITTPKLTSNIRINQKFEGLTPLFQEEKDVLFIFCLNNIFVISSFYNETTGELEHVILYELSDKPANTFPVTSSYFTMFNDLPTPYEPTLFLGNNRLDDVNLLSKVSKYKIFSQNKINSQGGINAYNLPTHYDEEKHGEYTADITFYKDKYKGQTFPVFLGKEGENFENLTGYGNIINQQNPILVEKGYIAKENFVFRGKKGETPSPVPVKEILGLTKEEFFEMRVKDSSQKIYQYLLNYAEQKLKDTQDDCVLVFKLPYERTSEYLVENDSGVEVVDGVFVEQRKVLIYVQFRYFETSNVSFVDKVSQQGEKIEVDDFEEDLDYPEYPPTKDGLQEFYIGEMDGDEEKPFEKNNFTIDDFRNMANNWLQENKNTVLAGVNNNKEIVLKLKMFERKVQNTTEYLSDIGWYQDWYYSDVVDGWDTELDYPDFNNWNDKPVIELGIINKNRFEEPPYNTYMLNEISKRIKLQINDLPDNSGSAWAKFEWRAYYIDSGGTLYEQKQKIALEFYYRKGIYREWENRNSFVMTTKVIKEGNKIVDDLYDLSFDKEKNAFVFKCKDYFYDFNNEPAIDVKITFERNPDYQKIAESSFGIAFGSENRLFLAGNKEYPNIDRFNVSNDLLGDNIKNQSYELTYFPSGNYRVLGGRGAINGYVVSTDTQLYITKEDYPNDQKLFIRNRTMDDNGIVGYNEFKTNIERTPLNNRTLVRFYNDILVLDKNGLFGLEIEGNVLTNERMVKMRSGFINKDLKNNISKVSKDEVFIYEDNHYMYMFVGKKVYVADSRYVDQNPNAEPGNFNYEIVEWEIPFEFKQMKKIDGELVLLDASGKHLFTIVSDNNDDIVDRRKSYMSIDTITPSKITSGFKGHELKEVLSVAKGLSFTFDNEKIYKYLALGSDFTVEKVNGDKRVFTINNSYAFRTIKEGAMIVFKHKIYNEFISVRVDDLSDDRTTFSCEITESYDLTTIFVDYSNKKLYPKVIYELDNKRRVILSPYEQEEIEVVIKRDGENIEEFFERVALFDDDYCGYTFLNNTTLKSVLINHESKIRLKWVSGVLDFDNNIFEKTMFRANVYATKQEKENWIKLGYRTMRRFNRFDETGVSDMMKGVEASNPMNFEEVDFNVFAINTLNEFGASIPMKENNFLYIQFIVVGEGNIELNAIEILYKLNRMLKTIS